MIPLSLPLPQSGALKASYAACPGETWPLNDFYSAMHLVQSTALRLHVVCLSVTLVDQDHISWKSWKLTARTISPTPSLFVAQRTSN